MLASDRFEPNEAMKSAARRGLEYRSRFKRGGTPVGIARARDIANGRSLPLDTVKRMYSFFARHEIDKKGADFSNGSKPSNGRVAWLLWGSDAGFAWTKGIRDRAIAAKVW